LKSIDNRSGRAGQDEFAQSPGSQEERVSLSMETHRLRSANPLDGCFEAA
jgi:hypothetical protein